MTGVSKLCACDPGGVHFLQQAKEPLTSSNARWNQVLRVENTPSLQYHKTKPIPKITPSLVPLSPSRAWTTAAGGDGELRQSEAAFQTCTSRTWLHWTHALIPLSPQFTSGPDFVHMQQTPGRFSPRSARHRRLSITRILQCYNWALCIQQNEKTHLNPPLLRPPQFFSSSYSWSIMIGRRFGRENSS